MRKKLEKITIEDTDPIKMLIGFESYYKAIKTLENDGDYNHANIILNSMQNGFELFVKGTALLLCKEVIKTHNILLIIKESKENFNKVFTEDEIKKLEYLAKKLFSYKTTARYFEEIYEYKDIQETIALFNKLYYLYMLKVKNKNEFGW